MDEIKTQEAVSNALNLRRFESYPQHQARRHALKAIEAARNGGSPKARVEIEALETILNLPKAHRVSS